jgi:hypothetical protein
MSGLSDTSPGVLKTIHTLPYPLGMLTVHADIVNPDLLAFAKS